MIIIRHHFYFGWFLLFRSLLWCCYDLLISMRVVVIALQLDSIRHIISNRWQESDWCLGFFFVPCGSILVDHRAPLQFRPSSRVEQFKNSIRNGSSSEPARRPTGSLAPARRNINCSSPGHPATVGCRNHSTAFCTTVYNNIILFFSPTRFTYSTSFLDTPQLGRVLDGRHRCQPCYVLYCSPVFFSMEAIPAGKLKRVFFWLLSDPKWKQKMFRIFSIT